MIISFNSHTITTHLGQKTRKTASSSPHQPSRCRRLSPSSYTCKCNLNVLSTFPYEHMLNLPHHHHSSYSKLNHMLHCPQQASRRLPPQASCINKTFLCATTTSSMSTHVVCSKNDVGGGNNQRGGT